MKVLLDECIPKRFRSILGPHEVRTVPEMGWAGISNGRLLELASGQFDLFRTVDRNLALERQASPPSIVVIVLRARSKKFEVLAELGPALIELLSSDLEPAIYWIPR